MGNSNSKNKKKLISSINLNERELIIRKKLIFHISYTENMDEVLLYRVNNPKELNDLIDVEKIIYMDCSKNKLENLEFIEKYINLKYLYCNDNEIINIEPICKLKKLKVLHCQNNQLYTLPNELINLTNLYEIKYKPNKNTIILDESMINYICWVKSKYKVYHKLKKRFTPNRAKIKTNNIPRIRLVRFE